MIKQSLWQSLNGAEQINPLSMKLYRMVENQEEIATTRITDNAAEQNILEELIEQSKPKQTDTLSARHYLIKTPFRYPPLTYGSRFGSVWQPSLFYGSSKKETVLAEVAYYRFRFLADVEDADKLCQHNLSSNHSLFYVNAHSDMAVQLTALAFKTEQEAISAPDTYQTSQALANDMREAGVELFSYFCARKKGAINGAAFTHTAIKSTAPKSLESWQCLTQNKRIVFHNLASKQIEEFSYEQFCVDGKLPIIR